MAKRLVVRFISLTFSGHANSQTLLEPTELTSIPQLFLDLTVSHTLLIDGRVSIFCTTDKKTLFGRESGRKD